MRGLIVIVLLCICLVVPAAWYLGKTMGEKGRKTIEPVPTTEPTKLEEPEPTDVDEKTLVKKDLKKLISTLNKEPDDEPLSSGLAYAAGDNYFPDNLWDEYAGMLMRYMYDEKYYSAVGFHGDKILMSKDQLTNLKKHFEITKEFKIYTYNFKDEDFEGTIEGFKEEAEEAKKYSDGEHYVAYSTGDGYGFPSTITVMASDIAYEDEKYEAVIVLTAHVFDTGEIITYKGNLDMTVKDGITQFGRLKLEKVK